MTSPETKLLAILVNMQTQVLGNQVAILSMLTKTAFTNGWSDELVRMTKMLDETAKVLNQSSISLTDLYKRGQSEH